MMSTFIFKISQGKVAGGLINLLLPYYVYDNKMEQLIYNGKEEKTIPAETLSSLTLTKDHNGKYVIKKGEEILSNIEINKEDIIGTDRDAIISCLNSQSRVSISIADVEYNDDKFALELSCQVGNDEKKAILNFIDFNNLDSRILKQYPYLTIKEENGRYIGCISDESGDCKNLISHSSNQIPYQIPIDNIGTDAGQIHPDVLRAIGNLAEQLNDILTSLKSAVANELRGDLSLKGPRGEPGIGGLKGDTGPIGPEGNKGEQGTLGSKGDKGVDGLPGISGPKGDVGLQGPKGQAGRSGLKGSKGDNGLIGMPGTKGEDGVGADVAQQFLHEINQTRTAIRGAQEAAEAAKNASERSATEAKGFKEEAEGFAEDTLGSEQTTRTLHSKVQRMFCRIEPTDQMCIPSRGKREIKKLSVTSGASSTSSWINVFANTIVNTAKNASQFISSSFNPTIDYSNFQSTKAVITQNADIDGILLLLDVFIRKITGQKYISTTDQSVSPLEALCYALNITGEFERVLKHAAVKSGISFKNLSFNPVSVQSAIVKQIRSGNFSKISGILYSFAEEACPNCKQADKFLVTFKDGIKKTLESNKQQKEGSCTEKTAIDTKMPRSFMSYVAPPSDLSTINQTTAGYLR